MSLLPANTSAVEGKNYHYYALPADVKSQIYTTTYDGNVSSTPYLQAISQTPLTKGTYLVSVVVVITAVSTSSNPADLLQLYAYCDGTEYCLYIGSTIPIGVSSALLNTPGHYYDITLSGLVTNSTTQNLELYVERVAGSGTYVIEPLNISYTLISPAST